MIKKMLILFALSTILISCGKSGITSQTTSTEPVEKGYCKLPSFPNRSHINSANSKSRCRTSRQRIWSKNYMAGNGKRNRSGTTNLILFRI
jgi:hypothetical protein